MVTNGLVQNDGKIIKIFMLAITPTAQMRPRFSRHGVAYKAATQKLNEKKLDELLRVFAPKSPINAPVSVEVDCLMPIPKSATKRSREAMTGYFELPVKKPDLDNCVKQILDGMTRCGFWTDDQLVCEIHARKYYAYSPCWYVTLKECVFHHA